MCAQPGVEDAWREGFRGRSHCCDALALMYLNAAEVLKILALWGELYLGNISRERERESFNRLGKF